MSLESEDLVFWDDGVSIQSLLLNCVRACLSVCWCNHRR